MLTRENVQVYVYSTFEKKVLMLKRIPEKAGYWQPVCGGIDKGESNAEAAKRELFEETGIEINTELIELPFVFSYKEPKNGVMMNMKDSCFLLRVSNPIEIEISNEHEKHLWCELSAITSLTSWEPILEVCKFIGEQS